MGVSGEWMVVFVDDCPSVIVSAERVAETARSIELYDADDELVLSAQASLVRYVMRYYRTDEETADANE